MAEIAAITMPKWGLTMTEGKILGWLKQPGEPVAVGEELLEIETSKITNVYESPEAGTLRRIVAQDGATLPIGALLAVMAPGEIADSEIDAFVAGFAPPEPAESGGLAEEAAAPREIEAGGCRLRVLELGAGDTAPILFVHGFGADLNAWMFTQPALAEVRRTIALDLPGHGGSAKQVGSGDLDALTGAVADAMAALGLARAHMVGHSLGGAVAATAASRHPERVASLTLIAPAGLGPEIDAGFIDGFVRAQRRREAQQVLALLVHDPALASRRMVEDVLRYKRLDGVQQALESIAAAWFPHGRQAVVIDLGAIAVPTQILWGRDDRIIPAAHAEAFAGRVPVHVLDAAGHLPHMERAGEVNRLIAGFIEPLG